MFLSASFSVFLLLSLLSPLPSSAHVGVFVIAAVVVTVGVAVVVVYVVVKGIFVAGVSCAKSP